MSPDLIFTPQQVLSGENSATGTVLKASDNLSKVALSWKETSSNTVQSVMMDSCTHKSTKVLPCSEGEKWDIKSMALGYIPGKVCVLARKLYTDDYTAVCAQFTW